MPWVSWELGRPASSPALPCVAACSRRCRPPVRQQLVALIKQVNVGLLQQLVQRSAEPQPAGPVVLGRVGRMGRRVQLLALQQQRQAALGGGEQHAALLQARPDSAGRALKGTSSTAAAWWLQVPLHLRLALPGRASV